PSLPRTMARGAIGIAIALVVQIAGSCCVVRRAPDRLAAAAGIALVGLTVALGAVGGVRAGVSPPFLGGPPPVWVVAVPAIDLAAAACALAIALTVGFAAVSRGNRSEIRCTCG